MTNRLLYFVAGILLSAIAFAEPAQNPESMISLPDTIAGFQRISFKDYRKEKPGLGVSYGYRAASGLTATVYIYNLGLTEIPSGIESQALKKLHVQTVSEIMQLGATRGMAFEHTLKASIAVPTKQGKKYALVDAFMAKDGKGQTDTFLWLWAAKNNFFKIRLTANPHDAFDKKEVSSFSTEVIRISYE